MWRIAEASSKEQRLWQEGLADGVAAWHLGAQQPSRVDVRVPRSPPARIPNTVKWLQSAFANVEWRVFIAASRDEPPEKHPNVREEVVRFAEKLFEHVPDAQTRVVGIDLVGPELNFVLQDWVDIIIALRVRLTELRGGDQTITCLHLGEDTRLPLKGICDIWAAVDSLGLGCGDRISHALDLLAPDRRGGDRHAVSSRQLLDMQSRVESICRSIRATSPSASARINALMQELALTRDPLDDGDYIVNCSAASHIAELVRPYVARSLVQKGVVIEACPTSNWRIGPLDSLLNHPICWWRLWGGTYLVGTDDPSFMPCSIASELYAVQRSLD